MSPQRNDLRPSELHMFPRGSVDAVLAGLEALGLKQETVCSKAGVSLTATPDELISISIWNEVWRAAERLDSRPELAFQCGLKVPFGAFGLVDYLAGSAASLGGAVASLAAHSGLMATGFRFRIFERKKTISLLIENSSWYESARNDDFALGALVGHFRFLTSGAFIPSHIHSTRKETEAFRVSDLPQTRIVFGSSQAGLEIARENLSLRLKTSDLGLHATLSALADRLRLKATGEETNLLTSIRIRLRDLLPEGQVSASSIALRLGLSERTLRRKLAAQDLTYQGVLEDFRTQEGQKMLEDGLLSLSEIALTLGYSEQSAWNRAFKAATGSTPLEWKKTHLKTDAQRR